MTAAFLMVGAALALEPVPVPDPIANECPGSIAIEYGKPIPFQIAGPDRIAKCAGILEPPSSFAYLLAVETRAETADKVYQLDVSILQMERDWYKTELAKERDRKWFEKPDAQRWFGRLEMLAIVGIIGSGMAATYQWSR